MSFKQGITEQGFPKIGLKFSKIDFRKIVTRKKVNRENWMTPIFSIILGFPEIFWTIFKIALQKNICDWS